MIVKAERRCPRQRQARAWFSGIERMPAEACGGAVQRGIDDQDVLTRRNRPLGR